MSLRLSLWRAVCLASVWGLGLSLVGCKLFDSTCKPNDRECLSGGQLRSGQACLRTGDCAEGLSCVKGMCAYTGSTGRNSKCMATAECAKGLYCSPDAVCKAINADPQPLGGLCASSADCEQGLVCDVDLAKLFTDGPYGLVSDECRDKLAAEETPSQCKLPRECTKRGKLDLGETCSKNAECLAGLYCAPNPLQGGNTRVCWGGVKLPQEPVSTPYWAGVKCPADATQPTAYFEVPRTGSQAKDFYRLPFPNDVRRHGSTIDLRDHPSPPPDMPPEAAVRFLDVAGSVNGFATNPVVYFRFSEPMDPSKYSLNTLRIIDITSGSPGYAEKASIAWGAPERTSTYICPHWLGLHRPLGSPLRPKTTYAAIVTTDIHTKNDEPFARSPDFEAMLEAERPKDADLARAWDTYAPLRAYLDDPEAEFTADQLLNAAVFTTQDATAIMPKLRAAVEANGTPEIRDLTVCGNNIKSPCEDATGRGACHAADPAFVEIHGHVALPSFQSGTPPYETPEDGGDIPLDGSGAPSVQGHPEVCFALSVPTRDQPMAGYPLLIAAHGTGGSFSTAMGPDGFAAWAATKAPTPSAVLSIDMPSHGSRRGNSTRPPEDLFFNFMNPAAARGNALQGAADLMSLTLLAASGVPASSSPIGRAVAFDKTRVVIFGHSQGATHASLMIGYESRVQAAVLSGVGGHLASSLRLKQKPVDIGSVLPFALFDANNEGKLAGGDANPMLALIQGYFDSADPINYANLLYLHPAKSAPNGHDVFMTYGLFDHYCPEETQRAYALAGGLAAVAPDLTNEGFRQIEAPAMNNVKPGTPTRTVAFRTYDPVADPLDGQEARDGHFVARATKRGWTDVQRFLGQALNGETPQIGQ